MAQGQAELASLSSPHKEETNQHADVPTSMLMFQPRERSFGTEVLLYPSLTNVTNKETPFFCGTKSKYDCGNFEHAFR